MKIPAIFILIFGTAFCSLEPTDYRSATLDLYPTSNQRRVDVPPSSRYITPTGAVSSDAYYDGPETTDSRRIPSPAASYGIPEFWNNQAHRRQYEDPEAKEDYESSRYNFAYRVKDEYGNDYEHRESREGKLVRGSYTVLLPDGRRQIVEYEADEAGFRPRIVYESSSSGDPPRESTTGRTAYPGATF